MSQPYGQSFGDPGYGGGGDVSRNVNVNLGADVSGFTQGMQQAQAVVSQLNASLATTVQKAESLSQRAGKALMHFSIGDFASLGAATGVASRLEQQMGTLAATSTVTGTNMKQLKSGLTDVFNSFPVWREQVVQLATAISNLGVVKAPDITKLTSSYIKLGGATGEDSTALASSGITLAKQMGNLDPSKIEKFNNELLVLSKTAGVSAQSITDFASALAPFARQAGIGQGQVEALSAAFQKAGADGQVAANAFSTLLSTITALKQAGGDASKYSGFLGMTQQQFKGMTPLQATQGIFNQISRGGAQSQVFTQDLGGIRVQGAIQRMAQSGDLQKMMAVGAASSGGTSQLDTASKAAFGGLNDSVTELRNQFTTLATLIGDPLIGAVKPLIDLFNKLMAGVNGLLTVMKPVLSVAAPVAGLAAGVAGFGLAHSGAAAALSMGRMVLGRESGPRTAMRHGQEIAEAISIGAPIPMNETARLAALGQLTGPQSLGFKAGQAKGMQTDVYAKHGQEVFMAMASGMDRDKALQQNEIGRRYAAGTLSPDEVNAFHAGMKPPTIMEAAKRGFNMAGNAANWFVQGQNELLDDQDKPGYQRTGSLKAQGRYQKPGGSGWWNAAKGLFQFPFKSAAAIGEAGGAGANLAAEALGGGGAAGRVAAGGLRLAGGLGAVAGMGARAIGGLAGLATGPVGIAAMIGLPIASAIKDALAAQAAKVHDISGSAAGAISSKYDSSLDATSTNVIRFGDAVSSATDQLAKFANVPLNKLASTDVAGDIMAVSKGGKDKYKVSDQTFSDIVKSGNKGAIQSYLMAQGFDAGSIGGEKFKTLERDYMSTVGPSGYSAAIKGMQDFANTITNPKGMGQPSFAPLAALAGQPAGPQVAGIPGLTQGVNNQQYRNYMDVAYAGTAAAAGTSPKALAGNVLQMGALSLGSNTMSQATNISSYEDYLNQALGVDPKEMQKQIGLAADKLGTRVRNKDKSGNIASINMWSDPGQAAQVLGTAIMGTTGGAAFAKQNNLSTKDFISMGLFGSPFPTPNQTTDQTLGLMQKSRLGQSLSGMGSIKAGLLQPDQPGVQQAAVQTILSTAMKQAGPGGNQAAEAQRIILAASADFSGSMKDASNAAADMAGNLQQAAQINFSPLENAINTIAAAKATIAAGTGPLASTEQAGAVGPAQQALAGGTQDLTGQAHQKIQAVKDFNIQQSRAQADYNQQVAWANDAFNTQQANAAKDYGTQTARSKRDFATQQERADYQNTLRITRSTRDFQTSQDRNTKQYDLSRSREVRDATKDQARNQEDYNTSRTRQVRDYYTQTHRAERDFYKDQGRQQEDFNTSRQREETQYQLDRTRSIEDFNTSQSRATADFHTSQSRELEHFQIQQSRMERDYLKSRNRAQEDFNTQLARQSEKAAQSIYNPMQRIQRQATVGAGGMLRNLSKQNAALEKQLKNLDKAKALGVSLQTIQTLDLANPANAQELDALIKSMQRNPNTVGQINAQVKTRVADTQSLTQNLGNLDYANQLADFAKTQTRAWEDYQTAVKDATSDLALSMSEQYADFVKETTRAQKDQSKNLSRSEHDHSVAMNNEMIDFRKNATRASADFRTSLQDQWNDLKTSLTDGEADFKKSSQRAKDDLKTSLADQAVDFTTQMANSLHDFKISMADAQSDFLTARANARHDQQVTLDDMQADYTTASGRAVHDHGVAMSQMETQYNTTLTRAGDDLKTSFQSVTGNLNDSLIQMAAQAKGQLAEYGPQAVQDYINWINTAANAIGNAAAQVPQPAAGGVNYGQPGSSTSHDQNPADYASGPSGGTTGHGPGHATGGITMAQHLAMIGEAGHELVLPLNKTGEQFMGGLMGSALGGAMRDNAMAGPGGLVGGQFSEAGNEKRASDDAKEKAAKRAAEDAAKKKAKENEAKQRYLEDEKRRKEMAELAARKAADNKAAKERHDAEVANQKKHDAAVAAKRQHDAEVANKKKEAEDAAKKKNAAGHPVAHPAAHPAAKPAAKPAAAHPATHPATAASQAATTGAAFNKAVESRISQLITVTQHGDTQLAQVITKSFAMIMPALKVEENLLQQLVQKTENTTSFAGAQIKVEAADVNAMLKQLQAAAKLKRLTSPVRH